MQNKFQVGDWVTVREPYVPGSRRIDKAQVIEVVDNTDGLVTSDEGRIGLGYWYLTDSFQNHFHEKYVFPYQEPWGDFDDMMKGLKAPNEDLESTREC